jgi:hypothetical protein
MSLFRRADLQVFDVQCEFIPGLRRETWGTQSSETVGHGPPATARVIP